MEVKANSAAIGTAKISFTTFSGHITAATVMHRNVMLTSPDYGDIEMILNNDGR